MIRLRQRLFVRTLSMKHEKSVRVLLDFHGENGLYEESKRQFGPHVDSVKFSVHQFNCRCNSAKPIWNSLGLYVRGKSNAEYPTRGLLLTPDVKKPESAYFYALPTKLRMNPESRLQFERGLRSFLYPGHSSTIEFSVRCAGCLLLGDFKNASLVVGGNKSELELAREVCLEEKRKRISTGKVILKDHAHQLVILP